ncbi:glycosyltransferase family 2 protein [Synechococcus sp. AH-736-M02]|nr:glycosyltransferase family 2 protein [Synechococcus sp. AH-736-M02]
MPIRVVMTLLVRNEEDVIAENILFHHAQGVSSFLVMDNLSTDATPEILRRLARFVPITYMKQTADTYDQAQWVTAMARSAYLDHGADWVINNDADEFWLFPGGDAPSFLDSVAPGIAGLFVQRFNAVLPESGRHRDGLAHPSKSRFFWRESVNALNRPLPPKCLHRAFADVIVDQGNHEIFGHQGSLEFSDQVSILHFPYRRFSSYQSKIRLGGAAYQRNKALPKSWGDAWRQQRQILRHDGLRELWRGLQTTPEAVAEGLKKGSIFEDAQLFDSVKSLRMKHRWFWFKCRISRWLSCN